MKFERYCATLILVIKSCDGKSNVIEPSRENSQGCKLFKDRFHEDHSRVVRRRNELLQCILKRYRVAALQAKRLYLYV